MSRNWGLVVGINRYDNLQALDFARNDAESLKRFFEAEASFDTVYFFGEDAPPIPVDRGEPIRSIPTFATLMRFLRIRFEQPFLKPADNFWFFFAGHGKRERDRDYLMPIDADPGNIVETAIPVSYVAERLRRCGADNVILLLDACRNEGARDGEGIGADRQPGVITLCSCSPAERSYEIAELRQGAFTYTLLEALRLQGETNCATVERLDLYLRHRVPEICIRYKKPAQHPYSLTEPISKRNLILLPRAALPRDIEPLKLDALQAEATGDLPLAEQLWWRVIAVAPTDAQAHGAVKRLALKQATQTSPPERAVPAAETRSAASTPTDQPRARARVMPRRRLIQAAAATVAGAGAIAVGWSILSGRGLQRRFETVEAASVDAAGVRQSPVLHRIEIAVEPLGGHADIALTLLDAGEFEMGSPDSEPGRRPAEGPQHRVAVRRFAIGRSTITQAAWRAVVAAVPDRVQHNLPAQPNFFQGDALPVETVSWNQAAEFCSRLSRMTGRHYRLPSEAEWEYACRAGTITPFQYGPTITTDLANYCGTGGAVCGTDNGEPIASDQYDGVIYASGAYAGGPAGVFRGGTTPVGTFPPNGFGLFDMHGNVWEHCLDTWTSDYRDAPADGAPVLGGPSDQHVLRGGAWSHNPAICRAAFRDALAADAPGWAGRIGFRVVCEL